MNFGDRFLFEFVNSLAVRIHGYLLLVVKKEPLSLERSRVRLNKSKPASAERRKPDDEPDDLKPGDNRPCRYLTKRRHA
jgi:hypothetical protein